MWDEKESHSLFKEKNQFGLSHPIESMLCRRSVEVRRMMLLK